jgi:Transcription elongation factor, N-terminal
MRKGFTREPQRDEPATQTKNYITPGGLQRLKEEHRFLVTRWAASNGDRSENADYQYGKRRSSGNAGSAPEADEMTTMKEGKCSCPISTR